jgi:hypothetical protein
MKHLYLCTATHLEKTSSKCQYKLLESLIQTTIMLFLTLMNSYPTLLQTTQKSLMKVYLELSSIKLIKMNLALSISTSYATVMIRETQSRMMTQK